MATKPKKQRPAAWLHTIRYETGEKDKRVTLTNGNPWGVPGHDYSEEFKVTTEPLYRALKQD